MAQSTIDAPDDLVDAPASSSSPHFARVAWRHKWLLLLGVVAGLVLGGLYYARATPVYESSAQILVIKKIPDALPGAGGNAEMGLMEDYMATHQALIKSPVIVGDAVRKKNLQNLPSFAGGGDPTRAIIDLLKVTRDTTQESRSASILSLSIRCREPGDCAVVLQAIIDSYKDFLDATYKNVSDDTVKLVTQARELLASSLTAKEKQYQDFRIHNPMLWQNKEGVSPFREHIARVESRRSELLLRQKEVESHLAALETALKEGRPRTELLALVAAQTHQAEDAGKLGASPTKQQDPLVDLEDQLHMLEQDYGRDYPQVKALKARIALLRARAGEDANAAPADPVQAHLALLREELANFREESDMLDKLSKSEQTNATGLFSAEAQNEAYRNEISRSQQLFDGIVKRLQEINMVKDFGGYDARCISPPSGAHKVTPLLVPILGLAGMLGLLVGLGLVYVADLSDQGFRNPEDLRRRLGLPIVGHIPVFTPRGPAAPAAVPGGEALSAFLYVFHRPKSREAEAFRAVRTALFFRNRAGDHKVIQVTSPDMSDGKTTLAANLALCIAQSGKRVILVDADCRRPRMHKLFGLTAGPGLAAVIGGKAELPDAVRQTAAPELSILPCGRVPPNPAELLSQPGFAEILDVLRTQYDYVIVDTPPLLAVTDPCIVAPLTDGVLLTVRLSKTARPHANRAKEILSTLGVSVIGVVVNAVNRRGSDAYGYNYYYHYEYRSSEYKRDGGSYYAEEEGTNGDGVAASDPDASSGEREQAEKPA